MIWMVNMEKVNVGSPTNFTIDGLANGISCVDRKVPELPDPLD